MRNRAKEIIIIVIVLTAIATISGLLLGLMNKVTYVDPDQALRERINEIYPEDIDRPLDIDTYQNIVDTKILNAFITKDNAYIIESKSEKAYSSDGLKLIVIIKDGKIIKLNGQGNHETPGLGTKALEDSYLNKFIGLAYDDMATDENSYDSEKGIEFIWGFDNIHAKSGASSNPEFRENTEFDVISGATKSSEGVIKAVSAALCFYDFMEGSNG